MIGIDLVKISRFDDKEHLSKFILSKKEYDEFLLSSNKSLFLATRFALKEAFFKANNVGLFVIPFKDITLIHDNNGGPHLIYQDKEEYNISISHEEDYVIAIVIKK